ncbi:hypothetical protein [Mycobacterium sp. NPDC006124]|uniref:hypothetical protein n=1 Tax=Mycobacterium sp. NPDC006124 TaxID=3156729 RepID=UPI0033AE0FB7
MADTTPVRAGDVLADGVDATTFDGLEVRKGSVAAFVANARKLARLEPGHADRDALEDELSSLAPALRAVGLLEVFTPRSAAIAAILTPGEG